jgi:hypothetical protein
VTPQSYSYAYPPYTNILYVVYNVNSALMQTVINQGSLVTLNAGYQVGSNYGTIFKGQVLRCTFEKENVTDHKLTLQCIRNLSTKC